MQQVKWNYVKDAGFCFSLLFLCQHYAAFPTISTMSLCFFFQVNIHDLQKICIAFHLSSYLYTGKYEIHKQTKGCESSYNEYADKLLLRTSLSKTLGTENSPQIYAS